MVVRFWKFPVRLTICILFIIVFVLFRHGQRWKHSVSSLLVWLIFWGILELVIWMTEFLKLEASENIMMLTLLFSVLDLLFKAQCRVCPIKNFRGERTCHVDFPAAAEAKSVPITFIPKICAWVFTWGQPDFPW